MNTPEITTKETSLPPSSQPVPPEMDTLAKLYAEAKRLHKKHGVYSRASVSVTIDEYGCRTDYFATVGNDMACEIGDTLNNAANRAEARFVNKALEAEKRLHAEAARLGYVLTKDNAQ